MGWSNSLPPQIQTLQDGSTQFNGPIVIDKPDGSTAASIGTDGSINGDILNINKVRLSGNDLQTTLDHLAKGVVIESNFTGDSVHITSPKGLVYISGSMSVDPNRHYNVYTTPTNLVCQSVGIWNVELALYTSYPTAGSGITPFTVFNRILVDNRFGGYTPVQVAGLNWTGQLALAAGTQVWFGVLLSNATGGGESYFSPNGTSASYQIVCEDKGYGVSITGVANPIPYAGGPPPPPPPVNYSKRFFPTWSQTWDNTGIWNYGAGTNHMYQGNPDSAGGSGHGIVRSACNFDWVDIGNNLNGGSNYQATFYFYCEHSWYNSGLDWQCFSHNTRLNSPPGSVGGLQGIYDNRYSGHAPNPGWNSIDISPIVNAFGGGLLSGFGFFVNSSDLAYYGYFGGPTEGAATPYIDASWTK